MASKIDIVDRLERIADASRRDDGTDIPLGEELHKAAEEIRRLRTALAEEQEKCAKIAKARKVELTQKLKVIASPAVAAQIARATRAREG